MLFGIQRALRRLAFERGFAQGADVVNTVDVNAAIFTIHRYSSQ